MAQQTHDIKGVVTDKRNEPIVGALVTAEGTDISSITDIDGKFLLKDVPVSAKKVIVESIVRLLCHEGCQSGNRHEHGYNQFFHLSYLEY